MKGAVVAAIAFALTLAYTLPYGSLNQATYMLDPLYRAMPELFRRDWFVSETEAYLPVFGYLAQWLYVLDPNGAIATVATHIVVMLATYAAIYWLVRSVQGGWLAFMIVASWATKSMALSMAGHYLIVGYLQPSSLATLGWVIAIAALAHDRFLICGIAAACAGALHANFLVLGVGLFALTSLARRDMSIRDFARVLGPQLVVLAFFVPSLLEAAGPSDKAVWILTEFHAPIHYSPAAMIGWVEHELAWQIGAYAAYFVIRDLKAARVLFRFTLVATAIVVGSALVIRYTPFVSLTQMRWARIAPFGQLATLVLMAGALIRLASAQQPLSIMQRVAIVLGFWAPLYYTGRHLKLVIGWPGLAVGAALIALALTPWQRVVRASVLVLGATVLTYALWMSPRGSGLTTRIGYPEQRELSRWVHDNTHVDALFLAPPGMTWFRLIARRAVIADSKSPPLRPDLLEQWHARLTSMVLMPDAPTVQATEQRYWELTQRELEQVARTFDADYIITARTMAFSYSPVYTTETLAVYRVP